MDVAVGAFISSSSMGGSEIALSQTSKDYLPPPLLLIALLSPLPCHSLPFPLHHFPLLFASRALFSLLCTHHNFAHTVAFVAYIGFGIF